ncbi:hypothetical protein [Gracilimonas tropica]|uniref:hypothetical protein n=1 Tax=Gracilimonas tropica TaxID=454600 RepID=UPI00035E8FA0|nr:hypothetical protein [Gracilimonas tropica]
MQKPHLKGDTHPYIFLNLDIDPDLCEHDETFEAIYNKLKKIEVANQSGHLNLGPELYGLILYACNSLQITHCLYFYETNTWILLSLLNQLKQFCFESQLITGNFRYGKVDTNTINNLSKYAAFCFSKDALKLSNAIQLSNELGDIEQKKRLSNQLTQLYRDAKSVGLENEMVDKESLAESTFLPSLQECIYGSKLEDDPTLKFSDIDELIRDWEIDENPLFHTLCTTHQNRKVTFSTDYLEADFIEVEQAIFPYIKLLHKQIDVMFAAFNVWNWPKVI